ncbi:MAG: tRNA (N(6)-L-threonylcarbamoyladenosine(37)-C(2))-methylthiotransferase MtaB [Chitinophagales bacterium]|nr:tRNA (N(6)-L-threonylcarbamoyladenosine(37)-C(2))-methylthiotransferase MtaB [Sphingobacteriales bacterium]MBP6663890.1 tRNA (N(6)-L-threonylcarbamoyladenosine(37)-C(2))-methylthiotransferase MtaB [Chitinophagales bacterium]MBP7534757.1 tRNA (N(6)-L-threonylcarbamoyladenosine(37)-C(2))-methylthiotransferase MtaB [Chitinophagales bacterium]
MNNTLTDNKKVAFYTLGCKLNYSETSTLGRLLSENGFDKVAFHEAADLYVINTCSVTDNADKKCRRVVNQALRHSPNAFVVVVGCYAQLKPQEIANIPGVDLVLGAAEKFNLVEHLTDLVKQPNGRAIASSVTDANTFVKAYSMGERTRSFLKVQDGCDYKCAFCTIPLARGSSRSDTIEHIVEQAHEIVQMGVKEIVLTGVNTGDYGRRMSNGTDREVTFFDLVRALDTAVNIPRIRISSIEPNLLTNEIIDYVAQSQRFMPHFHIPLQSGSNKILKLMRRRYNRELYADRVAHIKQLMPHCCIGVDVITGFPGETHEDFLETYHFLNDLDISYLHVFTYSERANTAAIDFEAPVPVSIRQDRTTQLMNLSEKKRRFFYQQHLGTNQNVLWEAENDQNRMFGFTNNYIKTETEYDPLLVNEISPVTLANLTPQNTVSITEEVYVL